jgi:hypothetical protein
MATCISSHPNVHQVILASVYSDRPFQRSLRRWILYLRYDRSTEGLLFLKRNELVVFSSSVQFPGE